MYALDSWGSKNINHDKPSRVFLSRLRYEVINQGAVKFRCLNFEEIHKFLLKKKFSIVYPELYSLHAIRDILSNAEIIVCEMGSCDSHLISNTDLMMRLHNQDVKVIQMIPKAVLNTMNNHQKRFVEWCSHLMGSPSFFFWSSCDGIKSARIQDSSYYDIQFLESIL